MSTSDLIDLISHQELTDVEVYNLLTADMFESVLLTEAETPAAQKVIRFFEYQISAVLVPVIDRLRAQGAAKSN